MTVAAHQHGVWMQNASAWTAENPVLGYGQKGREADTGREKTGDGVTAWNALGYDSGGGVPVSRQVLAGTGLTGGGDLSVDRTLTVAYGTAAGTAAQGNDSRIVNAVPNTRTINNGYGLIGWGNLSADRTPAVALTKAGATIGSDVSASASTLTTIFTTSSLAAGTWLLTADATFVSGTGGLSLETQFVVASGTATFTGPTSKAARANTNAVEFGTSLTTIVNVTVAATITFQGQAGATWTAKASTSTNAFANATGWTAVRIA